MKNLYLILIFFFFFECKNKETKNNSCVDNKIEISKTQVDTLDNSIDKIVNMNDTLSKILYKNGKIKDLILDKDSMDAQELHLSFYINGNLKSKGLQGNISNKDVSTGMAIATWFYYDANKNLDSTIYYNNADFGKDYIEKKEYYKNGTIKSIEKCNNYILYENEMYSIGKGQYFDEKGNQIKK